MSSYYDTEHWAALSAAVTRGARCVRCGTARGLVAHHKIPRPYGGADSLGNLEPLCRECHPEAEAEAVTSAILAGRRRVGQSTRPRHDRLARDRRSVLAEALERRLRDPR